MASDCISLHIKVVPNASRDGIAGWLGDHLKVRVQAPPEAGRANIRVMELLASELGVPEATITLVRGGSSQRKTVEIRGLTLKELRSRLAE